MIQTSYKVLYRSYLQHEFTRILFDIAGTSADDTALVEAMHAIMEEFEACGWRRLQAALRHRGRAANHTKIKRCY